MSAVKGELLAKNPKTRAYIQDPEGDWMIQDLEAENLAQMVKAVNAFIRHVAELQLDLPFEVLLRIPKSDQPYHLLKPSQRSMVHQKDVAHLFNN